jgi:enoyl-CoA hydratase/carnithine racemase
MYDHITYEVTDPVAVITLARPERLNAFTNRTLTELRDAVERASADPAIVGTVITGQGRGFCAGLDAEALADTATTGSAGYRRAAPGELPGLFSYFLVQEKPIIAAVNGVVAGGGLVLAAMADVRFASTEARFTAVFSKRGLVAEHGTSWILPRLLGPGRALDLLWTSRMVDAAEAERIGLVEYLCEPGELIDRAVGYVADLAATVSPASIRDTKQMVYRHLGLGYADALADADELTSASLDRPDLAEGVAAYTERRAPRFARIPAQPARPSPVEPATSGG